MPSDIGLIVPVCQTLALLLLGGLRRYLYGHLSARTALHGIGRILIPILEESSRSPPPL